MRVASQLHATGLHLLTRVCLMIVQYHRNQARWPNPEARVESACQYIREKVRRISRRRQIGGPYVGPHVLAA